MRTRLSHLERRAGAALAALAALAPPGASTRQTAPTPAVRAVRATTPPVIDGKDDDPVWRAIRPTSGFRQYYPREDGEPTVETRFQVAYDDRNLYVFVRALDPHPDSIMHALTRRDVNSASDLIGITIGGLHDGQTGVEFAVNPVGVKHDCAVYADTLFDWSWDGVWDAATRIDAIGWTAEFRIPFSQFRYTDAPAHTFGFAVWRNSYRYYESSIWPLWRISRGGLMSQLADLAGIDHIASSRALEITPYAVATNALRRGSAGYERDQRFSAGADVQYAFSPDFTIDATVHPDFGQVEADPSMLNLTAAETFYPEQRPFFLEGKRLYELDLGCTVASCSSEGLFYSRRIGRAPELLDAYGDANSPTAATIAAAVKLTGRTDRGLTLALLDAATERAAGAASRTIEPRTNYAVLRADQVAVGGRTSFGVMLTAVNRSLDPSTADSLRRDASVAALDVRQLIGASPFGVSALVVASRVDGSATAIARTQRSGVHYYQRPDGPVRFDSTRTSLAGDAEEVTVGKYGGAVQFTGSLQRHSAGLEVNDAGYLARADLETASAGISTAVRTPHWISRLLRIATTWQSTWNSARLPTDHAITADVNELFTDDWSVDASIAVSHLATTFCDFCSRGGPALRQDVRVAPSLTVSGDSRGRVVPSLALSASRADGGRTRSVSVSPSLSVNAAPNLQLSAGGTWVENHDNTQWYGNVTDSAGSIHYAFARLAQRTLSFTVTGSYAPTPTLSIELYAAPFVSTGTYSDVRELGATPRASSYDARFAPYAPPPGSSLTFDVRQLRANLVARWEYKPGSTLFIVWTHERDGGTPVADRSLSGEYASLLSLHPDNTIVVKASYWLGR